MAALIAKVGGRHVPPVQQAVVTVSGAVQATAKQQLSTLVKESLIFFKNRHSFTFMEKCMEKVGIYRNPEIWMSYGIIQLC